MSDIIERLRDSDSVVLCGLFHAIPAMRDAADEIEQLRADLATSREMCTKFESAVGDDLGEILQLRAQVETMSAALKPFADLAKIAHQRHRDSRPVIFGLDTAVAKRLTIGDLRAALLVLPSTVSNDG